MEMEFKDPTRRRRMVFVTVGLAVAAIAGVGAFTLASGGGARRRPKWPSDPCWLPLTKCPPERRSRSRT